MTINVTEKVIFSSKTVICFRIVVRKAKVIGEKKIQHNYQLHISLTYNGCSSTLLSCFLLPHQAALQSLMA